MYIRWYSASLDRNLIYQASGLQVNFVGLEEFSVASRIIKEFPIQVSDQAFLKVLQFAVDNSGKPYSVKELLGYGWAIAFAKKTNPLGDGRKTFVCSELVGTILDEVLQIPVGKDLDLITPKDVFVLLDK